MATVLVVGSGGREHALTWKLKQSPVVEKLYVAPGNGGTADIAENVPIAATDIPALVQFAREHNIDLTVIGPDDPLAMGIVNAFKVAGLKVFGPSKEAARIEASKAFAKDIMANQGIPTAKYKTFTESESAYEYVRGLEKFPVVVKASGLALGKGVMICHDMAEAESAVRTIMVDNAFGEAGNQVVIEEYLEGQEVSVHALSDGDNAIIFPPTQDHKQIYDGDQGPNTGGMGVIGPVSWVNLQDLDFIATKVFQPALKGLSQNGEPFVGCLYPGLMMTQEGPKVLEYNARFGDPETQVYVRLLDTDLYELLRACANGTLDPTVVAWRPGFAACVVLASGGYPANYEKGLPISGLEEAAALEGVEIFHAGTSKDAAGYKTSGGRVLGVTAMGGTLDQALERAYAAVEKIDFDGMQYRTDIGRRPAPEF